MPIDLGEQAIQIAFKGGTMTLAFLLTLAQNALDSRNRVVHGEQDLQKLNLQGRQLESVKLTGEDIRDFRRQLNKYAVDFAVMKDKATGEYSVYFKGQDIERVYSGLEKTLQAAIADKDKKQLKEVIDKAMQKSAEQAEQREQQKPEKNRSVDRTER